MEAAPSLPARANRARRSRKTGLVALAAFVCALLLTEGATADKSFPGGTICAGNDIYVVCVRDDADTFTGRYTARTGPNHPVPNRNVLFGGEASSPGTSFNSYRSFTSGTTYTQGAVSGAVDLDTVPHTTVPVGTTGVRTTWTVTTPDELTIEQLVNVNGTTFNDSNVEVTTTITNDGQTSQEIGIRYLWDFTIGADDGPTFQERNPDGPERTVEAEFTPVNFEFYSIHDNDFADPTSPLYDVLGTALGPATVTPAPTEPTQISYACWPDAINTAFDFSTSGKDVANFAANGGDCDVGGGGDSSTLYWWGRTADSARLLDAGESVTERALLFAVEAGEPPPGALDHFTCYSVGRSPAAGLHVRMHDQFGAQRRFVNRAQLLCPPVTKTREHEVTRPTNEQAHLKCYDVRRDEPFPTRRVRVVNQFSPAGQVLELAATALFCLPAVKDPQSGDPGPGELGLDHFKCYDTTGPAVRVRVGLEDQFQRTERAVGRPVLVCNPAGKLRLDNGEEIRPQNREAHLVCYSLGRTTTLGRHVVTEDQFRQGQATTVQRLRHLCVPSTKERLRRGECAAGGVDHCIEADGTTTHKEGIWDEQAGVFAADVRAGDPLASFPGANPLNSGLLLFDRVPFGVWTDGLTGDDLVLEGKGFCGPSSLRDGDFDAGVDCVVLDLNSDLAPGLASADLFATVVDPNVKYHDVNQNGSWDDSEDIVYSVDNVYN